MMMNDIDKVIQRTHRYWYEDSLNEIATGCMFEGFAEQSDPPGR